MPMDRVSEPNQDYRRNGSAQLRRKEGWEDTLNDSSTPTKFSNEASGLENLEEIPFDCRQRKYLLVFCNCSKKMVDPRGKIKTMYITYIRNYIDKTIKQKIVSIYGIKICIKLHCKIAKYFVLVTILQHAYICHSNII